MAITNKNYFSEGRTVEITLKSWKGSRQGTIPKAQWAANQNDLVTVRLPEGDFDFRARNLKKV
jgi:hypothetical protein